MVKKNGRSATNDLARLAGVRSVLSNEVEEGSRLTPLGNSATVADTPTGIARERTKKKPRVNGAFSRNLIPNCVRHALNERPDVRGIGSAGSAEYADTVNSRLLREGRN